MLYYNTHPQRQLISDRLEQLAEEMRRGRRLTPEQVGYPGLVRRAREWAGAIRLHREMDRPKPSFEI